MDMTALDKETEKKIESVPVSGLGEAGVLSDSEEIDMGQLLAQEESSADLQESSNGSFLMAKVISISKDGALVDIGRKAEALVPRAEFGLHPPFNVGDTIPVLRIRQQTEGYANVSWRAAREKMAWEEIEEMVQRKMPVQAKVLKEIKGGLAVECENGLKAFMPSSQVDLKPVRDLKGWKGRKVTAYVMEHDHRKGNLVLSRRQWISEENEKKKTATLASLKTGDVRKGTVTGITSFGAFVDLGGIEGLLYIGEIEWAHTAKVSNVLKVGQTIEVKVIKYDPETGKISLSRKVLLPHPWDGVEKKFPAGSVANGKVVSLTDFGAFVEIAPNVEGLLHVSELSWKGENVKPKDLLKVGMAVEVRIISVNREKEKISLSLKRVGENPWDTIREKYPVGSTVKVTVSSLAVFGAFAKLPEGLEGLIHITDFSWAKRVRHAEDVLKVGQEADVQVLEVDPDKEKIAFGLKQLKPNPFKIYSKGAQVKGKVTAMNESGAVVELDPDTEAFVPLSEISNEKYEKPEDLIKVGDMVEAKVIAVDAKEKRIHISIRKLERDLQRAAQAKYSGKTPGPALGDLFE